MLAGWVLYGVLFAARPFRANGVRANTRAPRHWTKIRNAILRGEATADKSAMQRAKRFLTQAERINQAAEAEDEDRPRQKKRRAA
jgi:hypothetical protein